MKALSISLRLALWYSCISAAGFVIFGIAMWFVLAHSMVSWKDRTLQMRASHVQAALASLPHRDRTALDTRLEQAVEALPEGDLIQEAGPSGERLFPLNKAMPPTDLPGGRCDSGFVRDRLFDKEKFRQICSPAHYAGETVFIVAASPLSEDRILLRTFTQGLYRTIPLILLVSGASGYILSRRALRPVDRLIAEARSITPDDLSRRLTISAPDDQLRRLAIEWNSLLARIDADMVRVTQFTADASHELRTPIAYIRATAEYSLGNAAIDHESREAFGSIVEETRLIGELLENLLCLARLDGAAPLATQERVDANAVAREVATYFESIAQTNNQHLIVKPYSGQSPLVRITTLHLRQVLTAILDNAIKYTPSGGSILVSCSVRDTVDLTITDSGIGMAEEHLHRIFDRFYRVDQARTDRSEGTGLGLSIARLLTELYGGCILVTSRPGAGASFTIQLPAQSSPGSL